MMNTFYILLYHEIFNGNKVIGYLENQQDIASLKTTFSQFILNQKLKSFNTEDIILFSHLTKYVIELPNKELISCKLKYKILSSIFVNDFFDECCREKVIDRYCKIQRRYMALNRFAYLWKVKKALTCVDTDLYLNTIEPTKRNSFVLFQNNKKYCFIITDLIKILEHAVCHEWEDNFDIISKNPCNPYNKQPFLKHDLYNIYFHMRFNMLVVIPPFFHLWFIENFDLSAFPLKHTRMLRKICIKNHVFNVSNTSYIVYKDIREMLMDNSYTRKWVIHADFPRETLVDLMRPYLYIFYLIYYDVLDYEEQVWYEAALTLELIKCYKFNPQFGRRIVNPTTICAKSNKDRFVFAHKVENDSCTDAKEKYSFNTKTIKFSSLAY